MSIAGGDRREAPARGVGVTGVAVAPTLDGVVRGERACVVVAGGYGGEAPAGWVCLAGSVVAPARRGAVGSQATGVIVAGGYGGEAAVRWVCLAGSVVAPARRGAVGTQATRVLPARGDGGEHPSGLAVWPNQSAPQHVTVPKTRNPQEWLPPELMATNCPGGGVRRVHARIRRCAARSRDHPRPIEPRTSRRPRRRLQRRRRDRHLRGLERCRPSIRRCRRRASHTSDPRRRRSP